MNNPARSDAGMNEGKRRRRFAWMSRADKLTLDQLDELDPELADAFERHLHNEATSNRRFRRDAVTEAALGAPVVAVHDRRRARTRATGGGRKRHAHPTDP